MSDSPLLLLLYNASLLLTLVVLFSITTADWRTSNRIFKQIVTGLLIGFIGIIVVLTHWDLGTGIFFDTRSVLLGISGLFFGPLPTMIAMVIVALLRFSFGGVGVIAGLLVIGATGMIGIIWHKVNKKPLAEYTLLDYYVFGLAIHVVMLPIMFVLPWQNAIRTLSIISFPVMVIYPLMTAMLGVVMSNRLARERLGKQLADNERRLRIIADYSTQWEYWIGLDRTFIYCSPSCEQVTGYPKEYFLNDPTHLSAILRPEDLGVFFRSIEQPSNEHVKSMEIRIRRPDGAYRWIAHTLVPLYAEDGSYLGIRGNAADITEKKETDLKLQNATDELRALLETAELSRKALLSVVEDQKIAQEKLAAFNVELEKRIDQRTEELHKANQELEAFSYSVSHDLRAPLRAISGFTRILKDEYEQSLPMEGRELLGDIISNSSDMSKLIDNLLELSRLSRKELSRDVIEMGLLFKNSFEQLCKEGGMNNILLEMDVLPSAYADPFLIRQVVLNLLSNAIKFSSKREQPAIRITGYLREGVSFYSVTDNGVGFDSNYKDKLFQAFNRLHKLEDFPGTGVGLAIVKRIIERHRGTVQAVSELDAGATFTFTLPHHSEV